MSSHLTGAHRRSGAENNSRERHNSRTKESSNGGGTNNSTAADYNAATAGGHSRARGQHSNENQVKEAIIDLYLKVKIRT